MSAHDADDTVDIYTEPVSTEITTYALAPGEISEDIAAGSLAAIRRILRAIAQDGSYGTILKADNIGPVIVIGAPNDVDEARVDAGNAPLPVKIFCDALIAGANQGTWFSETICDPGKLIPGKVSVGRAGDHDEAGSFCSWVKNVATGQRFGISAKHVFGNNAAIDDMVVSPSAQEVTNRFRYLLPYTTYLPSATRGSGIRRGKEAEAKELLDAYQFVPPTEGSVEELLTIADNGLQRSGILQGRLVGKLVAMRLNDLAAHVGPTNTKLKAAGKVEFLVDNGHDGLKSRCDIAVFAAAPGIPTSNEDPDGEQLSGWRMVGAGQAVTKWGRTTGQTFGVTNAVIVVSWMGGKETNEFAIISSAGEPGALFAQNGDSGSLLQVEEGTQRFACGLIHGKCDRFAIFTPMAYVLETVGVIVGGRVEILQ